MDKARKCWCGKEAHVHTSAYTNNWHVSCDKSNDHVPWYDGFTSKGGFATEQEAIDDWNEKMQELTNFIHSRDLMGYVRKLLD